MSKIQFVLLLIIVFVFYFLISIPNYSGDIKNHFVWARSLLDEGVLGFYSRDFQPFAYQNYPPLAMFFFAISLFLYDMTVGLIQLLNSLPLFPSNLVHLINQENITYTYLKLPAIVSAIAISYCLYLFANLVKKETDKKIWPFLPGLLFILNPATIYLSAVWGQIDLLPICFFMFALYALFKKNIYLSIFLAALSLLTKQTIILFWGLYILMILKVYGFKMVIKASVITFIVFEASYLFFNQFSLIWPIELYKENFSLVSHTNSLNAINFWGDIIDFYEISDKTTLYSIPFYIWGYIYFGVLLGIASLFFFTNKLTVERTFQFLFLVSISYFFVLTRMHERYLIPAIVFSSLLILFNKRNWINLIFFSVLHFLNLYRGLPVWDVGWLNQLVNSIVFLKLLVAGYFILLLYNFYDFIQSSTFKLRPFIISRLRRI